MMQVVVITGASSGIGEALSLHYLQQGFRVVMAARRVEPIEIVLEKYPLFRNQVLVQKTDVSIAAECQQLIEQTIAHFGRIDILINNAGISMRALFVDADLAVIQQLMQVNFWGTVYCTKYALPYLLASKGSVVGVSSIAGYKGLPARTGYSASKFAMQGFLETLRIENRKNGLHVLIACPGFTASNIRNTALSANGSAQGESPRNESKMMSAQEVACHIFKAVKNKKPRLILTMQGKLTVWLNKFFPSLVDRLVYNHMAKEPNSPLT